eukprot:1574010-Prymnesium_polylepis.1
MPRARGSETNVKAIMLSMMVEAPRLEREHQRARRAQPKVAGGARGQPPPVDRQPRQRGAEAAAGD